MEFSILFLLTIFMVNSCTHLSSFEKHHAIQFSCEEKRRQFRKEESIRNEVFRLAHCLKNQEIKGFLRRFFPFFLQIRIFENLQKNGNV